MRAVTTAALGAGVNAVRWLSRSPTALTLIGVACWAAVEQMGKTMGPPYHTVQLVWTRYFIHLVFVLSYVALRGKWRELRTVHPVLQFVRGSMMLAMPVAAILGALRASIADLFAVFWLGPLLTIAVIAMLRRERVTVRHVVVALVVYATAILALKPSVPSPWAVAGGLGMAGAMALYMVLTRRLAHEGVLVALLSTSVSVFLILTVPLFMVWITPDPLTLAKMITVGVLGFTFLMVFDQALHLAPASYVAPVLGAQPVLGVLLGSLVTGRAPGVEACLGAAAFSGALVLLMRGTSPADRRPTEGALDVGVPAAGRSIGAPT